jgi:cellulose synthase/poly-beta-1,6-N-acetylglucosamine synthase-like glycosyltransferase
MLVMRLTVGICAYNEGKNIGHLLENILCEQEISADSEVLVVCSGCTDNTVEIAQEYAERDSRVKAYVESERLGKATAVNRILANAKGDAILFISADTLPTKGCFSRLSSKLQIPKVGLVCGRPQPVSNSDSVVSRFVQVLWRFHDHVFEQLNDAGLARHASEIFCIRRGIIDKIPAETVNDDAYIALVTKKKGWDVRYDRESSVLICGPETFPDYFKQRRRILFGHYQVRKLTGESPQHLIYLMPLYPARVIRLLSWFCTEYGFATFLAFISIELMINNVALLDYTLGKKHVQWSVSTSTKKIASEGPLQSKQQNCRANQC